MNDTSQAPSRGEFFVNVFSGAGLGSLLGVIVGLSITPVVSVVVGALASLLAVFLGLEGGADTKVAALGNVRLNGLRIGSFGFATVIGLLFALFIRANDPFVEPIDKHLNRWIDAKFPEAEARELVVYERTGIAPKGATVDPKIAAQRLAAKTPVLFAASGQVNLCSDLDPDRAGDDPVEILPKYRKDENATLVKLADQVEKLPRGHQLTVLKMLHELLCELQKGRPN